MKYKNVIFFLLVIIKSMNKGNELHKVKHYTVLNRSHFKIKLIIIILLFENQSILSFQINTRRPFLSYILIRSTFKRDVLSTVHITCQIRLLFIHSKIIKLLKHEIKYKIALIFALKMCIIQSFYFAVQIFQKYHKTIFC